MQKLHFTSYFVIGSGAAAAVETRDGGDNRQEKGRRGKKGRIILTTVFGSRVAEPAKERKITRILRGELYFFRK